MATATIAATVPLEEITALLDRHAAGNWGELDPDDMAANDPAHRQAEGPCSPSTPPCSMD